MTEEELEVVNEKRERIRKKDQEEAGAKGAKGGKAPPAKGAKGGAAAKGAAAPEEEDSTVLAVFPKAESHVNTEIKEFLDHFASSRKIILGPNPMLEKKGAKKEEAPRKRSDEEKQTILDDFSSAMTQESEAFAKIAEEREA